MHRRRDHQGRRRSLCLLVLRFGEDVEETLACFVHFAQNACDIACLELQKDVLPSGHVKRDRGG